MERQHVQCASDAVSGSGTLSAVTAYLHGSGSGISDRSGKIHLPGSVCILCTAENREKETGTGRTLRCSLIPFPSFCSESVFCFAGRETQPCVFPVHAACLPLTPGKKRRCSRTGCPSTPASPVRSGRSCLSRRRPGWIPYSSWHRYMSVAGNHSCCRSAYCSR